MTLPTSLWGNFGNTLYTGFPTADVYSVLPGPTTTTPGSSDGPHLGDWGVLEDGTEIQFLQTVATTANYAACKASVWKNAYEVTPTTAVGNICYAVNDRAGQSLTANYYTWFTKRGLAFPLVAASVGAAAVVAPSSTGGTLYAATVGTDGQWNLQNTVAVGGTAASSPVLII